MRERQAAALPGLPVRWHDELAGLPADRPLLLVANEFLDALPIRQFVRQVGPLARAPGRRRRGRPRFGFVLGTARRRRSPRRSAACDADLPDGTLLELAPAREALVEAIALRLAAQGGLALLIDYGATRAAMTGDTLPGRAPPRRPPTRCWHRARPTCPPMSTFAPSRAARCAGGAAVYGPRQPGRRSWGGWASSCGCARLLERATPAQPRPDSRVAARACSAPRPMGELFKVWRWPHRVGLVPPGFEAGERRR